MARPHCDTPLVYCTNEEEKKGICKTKWKKTPTHTYTFLKDK
jgi:hypothetical protein